jgi:hypothetical protein
VTRIIEDDHRDLEFARIGWQIIFSIRRLASDEQWQCIWDDVIAHIFFIGSEIWARLGLSNPNEAEGDAEPAEAENFETRIIEAEAEWRVNIMQDLEII